MNKALSLIYALALAAGFATTAQAQDAKAGEKKAAMCIGCHGIPGYQASFPEIHKVPMISGQSGKYIVAALAAYKKGERKHPTMKGIAASLTDQDMADLGAFYETHGGATGNAAAAPAAPATVAELLKKGNCASCHGENLNKPIDPSYPKLAGQHADYLFVALKAYQTENNAQVGRGNAIMAGMAKPFSHAELKAMASYIASLPSDLKTVPESRFR
ncbi:c-type cytochrome [Variovorax sp. YR752]|uniref:c-type cytochrome n=1 Tax=Variovorax sp. YR752 TaxID=1884383 RepID=UPI003138172E